MQFSNVYDDAQRALTYASLEFPGTYYLAFRDLPDIIGANVTGHAALDFGCGAGRSTRFLKSLGFDALGIDISPHMIEMARQLDPGGAYELIEDGDLSECGRNGREQRFDGSGFDLILSAFAFDNIDGVERRCRLLRALRGRLSPAGRIILLGSTPEIYTHEWLSFSTRDFAQNRTARSGDMVRIVMKDVNDPRPVVDIIWFHDDYLRQFAAAGLEVIAQHKPIGRDGERWRWQAERAVAPWVIYVLRVALPVQGAPNTDLARGG